MQHLDQRPRTRGRPGGLSTPLVAGLIAQVRAGERAAARLHQDASLPARVAQQLTEQVKVGQAARDRLVLANRGLVGSLAHRHRGRSGGLEPDDLFQEGVFGLERAIDKFDPELGYRFSTYATWWIRQSIDRAVHNQARTVRIPLHVQEARRTGTRTDAVRRAARFDRLLSVELLLVDEPDADEDAVPTRPRLHVAPTVDDETAERLGEREWVQQLLAGLTEREREVIRRRFGFDGPEETLEQIGRDLGLTRERIRQIEARVLKRLRAANSVAADAA